MAPEDPGGGSTFELDDGESARHVTIWVVKA